MVLAVKEQPNLATQVGAGQYLNFQQGYDTPPSVMFRVRADTAEEAQDNVTSALTKILGHGLPVMHAVLSPEQYGSAVRYDVTVETPDPNALITQVRGAKNQGWRDRGEAVSQTGAAI